MSSFLCLIHKSIINSKPKPNQNTFTERCGPLSGAGYNSFSIPPDVDAPQPLVDRRSSVSLLKWTASKRNEAPTPIAARQGLSCSVFKVYNFYIII